MPLLMPAAMRFYKTCAITGTIIILVTVSYSWMRIQQFEHNVAAVFEKLVIENLEADSLKDELRHIDMVLNKAGANTTTGVEVDGIEYAGYEITRLRSDRENILRYFNERKKALTQSTNSKKHIMHEVRVLFIASLVFLIVGTLLAALGYLGWYYRIEMFEERRHQTR
jgi:hypothetical protein